MIDQQRVFGLLLDGARDALAVLRAEDQHAKDQEVERALEQRDAVRLGRSGRHSTRVCHVLG